MRLHGQHEHLSETQTVDAAMPRLHQDACRPETCISDKQLVSGYIYVDGYVAGYKLLVRDTCRLYLGDIIRPTIHLCHGRPRPFVSSNKRASNTIPDPRSARTSNRSKTPVTKLGPSSCGTTCPYISGFQTSAYFRSQQTVVG